MPFASKSQLRYMFSQHPGIAERWIKEYGKPGKNLPQHKGQQKRKRKGQK